MGDGVVAAALEDVHESHEIGIHIGEGILDGIAHAGLRTEVHDGVKALAGKDFRQPHAVCQVAQDKAEGPAETAGDGVVPVVARLFGKHLLRIGNAQLRQTRIFQLPGIVVIDVVESDNRVAAAQQPAYHLRPDKPGRPGNQYFHNLKGTKKTRLTCQSC